MCHLSHVTIKLIKSIKLNLATTHEPGQILAPIPNVMRVTPCSTAHNGETGGWQGNHNPLLEVPPLLVQVKSIF